MKPIYYRSECTEDFLKDIWGDVDLDALPKCLKYERKERHESILSDVIVLHAFFSDWSDFYDALKLRGAMPHFAVWFPWAGCLIGGNHFRQTHGTQWTVRQVFALAPSHGFEVQFEWSSCMGPIVFRGKYERQTERIWKWNLSDARMKRIFEETCTQDTRHEGYLSDYINWLDRVHEALRQIVVHPDRHKILKTND